MARENETWGYTRIKGALQNLGHELGRKTIKRILQEHGIDPAPERGRRMPWAKSIRAHLSALVGRLNWGCVTAGAETIEFWHTTGSFSPRGGQSETTSECREPILAADHGSSLAMLSFR